MPVISLVQVHVEPCRLIRSRKRIQIQHMLAFPIPPSTHAWCSHSCPCPFHLLPAHLQASTFLPTTTPPDLPLQDNHQHTWEGFSLSKSMSATSGITKHFFCKKHTLVEHMFHWRRPFIRLGYQNNKMSTDHQFLEFIAVAFASSWYLQPHRKCVANPTAEKDDSGKNVFLARKKEFGI